jgi:glycine/D-amino acid oxidase-like deaminating enzyme
MSIRMNSIVIVGAGIFGVSAALELRHRGYPVILVDPGPLPHPQAASTDISKVVRMDYAAEDFYTGLMETAFPIWEEWNRRWERPLYHPTGMLYLCTQKMAPGNFEYESYVRLTARGIALERVDPGSIRLSFPAWDASGAVDGYFNPRGGWVESAAVVRNLLGEAFEAGVTLVEGEAFTDFSRAGGKVTGIITRSGRRFPADTVLLAGGAWTPVLLPELGEALWPTGQPVFHFSPAAPEAFLPPQFPVWAFDLHTAGWYGFPAAAGGVVKIANHGPGWRLDPGGPRLIPAGEEARFRLFLQQNLPSLQSAPVTYRRMCFYCDSFDGDFWIGHDPEREGLVVCAGDSGHAFKFAPVLGGLIADAVEGRQNHFLDRFAWRTPAGSAAETPRK